MHVRLVHWHAGEAEERAARLRAAGFSVDAAVPEPPALRALRANPPDVVLIDLSRLPSQGRDFAVQLRLSPATRSVPIVFAGGDDERAARVQALLPDATFASWDDVVAALRAASPVADPVVPAGALAGYAGAPLAKKLGIGAGARVALVDAPAGFEALLGELPAGVAIRRGEPRPDDLVLWFVTDRGELERRIGELGGAGAGLWVVWPKRGSAIAGELTQPIVRRAGLARGLVDYKVCSVDATWTGLRFRRRGSG